MKIFGIGLSRTGTSSLDAALDLLGYRVRHYPSMNFYFGRLSIKKREFDLYDALTDLPVAHFYKQLDEKFPGSKFIHTVRDLDSWLESCQNYYRFAPDVKISLRTKALRKQFYGIHIFDRKLFADTHVRHHDEVQSYFAGRKGDLLQMNICEGEGFEKLSPFLGKDFYKGSFPHSNAYRSNK